jgi:beta-glucanase (GH16 family)
LSAASYNPIVILWLWSALAQPAATRPDEWVAVWADEFDGREIDATKWKFDTGGHGFGNNELQYYTDRAVNARIEDGALTIQAQRENFGNRAYTSAKLQSKAAWTYGRFEFRAKLPRGRGLWPAIWMMPTDLKKYGGWPTCGEIDILEQLGHEPDRIYGTLHFGLPHAEKGRGTSVALRKGSLVEDWHEYALEWYPGEIRWFADGELYQVQNDWFTSAPGAAWPAPFDRDFFLQLNLAVGGHWPGPPDAATSWPQKLRIDYVRVYRPRTPPAPRAKGAVKTEVPPPKRWEPRK